MIAARYKAGLVRATTNTGMTTSVACRAAQCAVSRLTAAGAAAAPAGAGGSGNKACEMPLTKMPVASPTAKAWLSAVTSA